MFLVKNMVNKLAELSNTLSISQPIEILPRIYYIPYPTSKSMLEQTISTLPAGPIHLLNLSQYPYPTDMQLPTIRISQHTYEYYTSLPLTITIRIIHQCEEWLAANHQNKVLLHCQQDKGRSAVFAAVWLLMREEVSDIADALVYVNDKLGIEGNVDTMHGSQHRMLHNVNMLMKSPSNLNYHPFHINKIIVNNAIRVPTLPKGPLKAYLELREGNEVTCKCLVEQYSEEQALNFSINRQVQDDFLISLQYLHEHKLYPMARMQLNTNFIWDGFTRVQMQDMDVVGDVGGKFMFVDVMGVNVEAMSELYRLRQQSTEAQKEVKEEKKEEKEEEENVEEEAFNIHDADDGHMTNEEAETMINNKLAKLALNQQTRRQEEPPAEPQQLLQQTEQKPTIQQEAPLDQKKLSGQQTNEVQSEGSEQEDMDDYFAKLQEQA